MNEMTTETRQSLGTYFRDTGGEKENRPQIALASARFRAIDLSCRACGVLALGSGLGFPLGDSAKLRFHPQPPILHALIEPKRLNGTNVDNGDKRRQWDYFVEIQGLQGRYFGEK